ncbi:Cation efflux system protein CzcA [Anaerohalosphaera lusitana]|uniref:Cation efflux system protein CzcA n=1 Tax=Anaerohalosphaera lusitana TaxID=1936003 RepID=A0A1U9NN06_9BACT|nr:CusA/CzcA family heavy metal efflux RND transporter [Anaerohalosphaera lusitana]AQT69124.1 Cation efflux system protein CzcA [Anaerohalosphaera lusitana]
MHHKIVRFSLHYRFFIVLAIIGIAALGIYHYKKLPVDAFPDISPVMVPVFAEAHGMAPEEVERLITFPIESAMNGLPDVKQIKSTSAFGMAVIYVYFEDDTDIYFARQIVSERLNEALSQLPEMHEPPTLGPISTGLGQVFIYYLAMDEDTDTEGKDPSTYLRELNDWVVKYQLQTVPGVTDILSIGGHVLQYQIRVDPHALNKFDVGLEDIVAAVNKNNENAGGQFLVLGNEEYLVRGIGLVQDLEHIRNIHVKVTDGTPVKVEDVANVQYGKEIRRGVVSRNGRQEVVSGIVMKLYGTNTSNVIDRLYEKIPEVQDALPDGVELVPYYEQADLVDQATWTVKKALLQGAVLVIAVLFIFLGNLRSAFIVSLALPLCAFISIILMRLTGISANLMSLGGIAIGIGMLGDGAIVMVENIFRHLNTNAGNTLVKKTDIIYEAAREVAKPIIFSILIIITVFLPIFSLEDVEGKMFSPMAFTLSFAMFGSLIIAIVAAPALCTYLLKARKHKEFILVRFLKKLYKPLLSVVIDHRFIVLVLVILAFASSLLLVPHLGTEFIPTLEEGSILVGVTMAPATSLEKGKEIIQTLERKVMKFDAVEEVISRIGRPEAGSHPHPVNYAEVHIELKPKDQWENYSNKKELIAGLNESLSTYPGIQLNFTQPIQNAFDELLSGIKAQVAIKLFGEDLDILQARATEIRNSIDNIPGLVDLAVEQSLGQPQVQVIADRAACERYGINVSDILELVELAIGGEVVDNIYLNTRRFGIHVRYQEPYRSDPATIENLLVHGQDGKLIPLKEVAEVKEVVGPIQVNREKNQRRWIVQGNVRGRDLGSVVADIKDRIDGRIDLPAGYFVEYGGQFENQQRAMARLSIIVPIVLVLIFLLLYLTFGSIKEALLIIINVPLALIGGIVGLYLMKEYLSVPAAVGFIALFGIAVQNGVVLVSYINQLRQQGSDTKEAIISGALQRLRPVLMTAMTTVLGLLPLLLSDGIGSEVQRPLASVVVFGLSSATILTLFVIPAFYPWFAMKLEVESE